MNSENYGKHLRTKSESSLLFPARVPQVFGDTHSHTLGGVVIFVIMPRGRGGAGWGNNTHVLLTHIRYRFHYDMLSGTRTQTKTQTHTFAAMF